MTLRFFKFHIFFTTNKIINNLSILLKKNIIIGAMMNNTQEKTNILTYDQKLKKILSKLGKYVERRKNIIIEQNKLNISKQFG